MSGKNIKRALDSANPNTLVPALITIMLAFCVVGSALSVVYSTHKSRLLSIEFQHLKSNQRELQVQWGRLLLERSTWSTHDRIWSMAHNELNMHEPKPSEWVIVTNGK